MDYSVTEKDDEVCVSLLTDVLCLCQWAFFFFVVQGIREKLRVREDPVEVFLKSICCPTCAICCQPCYLCQINRHVDRVLGYDQTMFAMPLALAGQPGGVPSAPPPPHGVYAGNAAPMF